MRRPVLFVLVAGLVTVAAIGGGLLAVGGDDDHSTPPPPRPTATPFSTTPLASYDTAGAVVERGPFCDRVDPRQVAAALGGEPADATSWRNGDRIEVAKGVKDVTHEYGCRWTGADGTAAQAWVFAPPIAAARAQRMVRDAAKLPGCKPGDGPAFGGPTLALTCIKNGAVRTSYRGLFGDAWLSCEVARPAGATWDATDRAGRWCVGVLEAASGS